MKKFLTAAFLAAALIGGSVSAATISIREQGMYSAGGIVVTSAGTFDPEDHWEATGAGQTAHVDHANVFYQLPAKEKGAPMVFLHGYGQSRMGWMTTPDGRDGWATIFLRLGHGVFLVDEPRRGEAGATSVAGDISTKTLDQRWYTQFRIGRWEAGRSAANSGSKFPNDDRSVDQFFRQMTPDTGMRSDMGMDFDGEMVARAMAKVMESVYEKTGRDAVLVTHSQGGRAGWLAAKYTKHIAAVIAVEPGNAPVKGSAEYAALAKARIPVLFYYGDYIDNGDEKIQATAAWRRMRQMAYDFARDYAEDGGRAEVIDLPKLGITGNDHFLFQDTNNEEIARHAEKWMKGLK